MSQWDPNQVPPNEGYQYFNQNFENSGLYFNATNSYDNPPYYGTQQYPQTYNQSQLNYYSGQQYFNSNNNSDDLGIFQRLSVDDGNMNRGGTSSGAASVSNSTLTATAKEFQPNSALNENFESQNATRGAVKKEQSYRRNKNGGDQNRSNWDTRNSWHRSKQNGYRNETYVQDRGRYWQNKKTPNRTTQQVQVSEESKTFTNKMNLDRNISKENANYYVNDSTKNTSKETNQNKDPEVPEATDQTVRAANSNKKEPYFKNNGRYPNYYPRKEDRTYRNQYRDNRGYGDRDRFSSRDNRYTDKQEQEKSKSLEEKAVSYKSSYKEESKERNFKDNWRNQSKNNKVPSSTESKPTYAEKKVERKAELNKKLDAASQRERLKEMVTRRLLECLVCCEGIRHTDSIWSCKQCYHILHLNCVIRWAKASKLETGWRCPACQNVNNDVPTEYRCFCDKVLRPQLEPGTTPHSCGEMCGRKGRSCDHTCTLLCHPGPCPDCSVMVTRSCNCGATKMLALCSAVFDLVCKNVCNKVLECGLHNCKKICHAKDCESCPEFIKQECYCGKVGRKVRCTREVGGATQYECGNVCGKKLDCGNHYCQKLCHPGDCEPCEKAPKRVHFCPCGQTKLSQKRSTCLDPISCCDKICNKPLKCGQPSAPHQCKHKCHDGLCPPCPLSTFVRCRCGHMDREIMCVELKSKADDARCEKRCTRKRQCCKHKCNQLCCIDIDHICPLICNHNLSCGLHRCEETCHRGRCPPCWRTSFQELFCECGSSVLYPPVACGTRPPPCSKPCSRPRECGHDVNHNCHTGPCPPCTVLASRWCYGQHEKRNTIPCHQGNFSCGLPCGKDMPCGRHKCNQPCHTGPCRTPCTQPCLVQRETCSHPCNAPCHNPPCPDTPCKQIVKVTCQCGLRSSTRTCMDLAGEYQSIAMSQLASKMADIQRGQTVDISDIVSSQKKPGTLKTLECNEECRIVERNRRLTIGLQIRNPDLSSKLMPRYSDYMKAWGKKDPRFCQTVHDKLSELVQLAKQSKQKSRSHSFDSMNRDKRHFVHEYCEHFGVESAAYDQEPNRNVVATAHRDKSWLPSLSLLEVIQRENGQRKVPGPVLTKSAAGKSESVSLNKLPIRVARPATPPGEFVDYFNSPPT